MTQNLFGTLTSPSLPLLDANFSELYSGVTVADFQPAQTYKSPSARIRVWPYYTPYAAGVIDAVNISESANTALVIASSVLTYTASQVVPLVDNAQTVGSASKRPSQYYGATGSINTSDAREKTPVAPLTANEIAAAKELTKEIGTYRWWSAVQAKGDSARHHVGLTVQRAIEVMQTVGLNPMAYGFICYDQWPAQVVPARTEQRDTGVNGADGQPLYETVVIEPEKTIPGGDRYSFRMDELLAFIAAGLEARIAALETAPAP